MICSDQGSRKVTKIKCVFRKLLCLPSCMYKRSDQEKMQWSPTWQVYQQQAKVIWSFSLMAKQPFLLEERSPGQPRWSQLNQQGYLITMRIRNTLFCPDKYPTKSTPYLRIQQNTASKSGKNVIKTLKSLNGYKLYITYIFHILYLQASKIFKELIVKELLYLRFFLFLDSKQCDVNSKLNSLDSKQ